MSKEEIALKLTLAVLERFDYKVSEYGGHTLTEHQEILTKLVTDTFNQIYEKMNIKD